MGHETDYKVDYARRHFRFGWWSLLCFTTLGLVLEALNGFKVGAYLSASNETRRLMWTLAHAHGTLLSIIHIAFALSVKIFPEIGLQTERIASRCLLVASVLVPGGFFLGGVVVYGGDPSLGILLLPAGAACLLIAVFVLATAGGRIATAQRR